VPAPSSVDRRRGWHGPSLVAAALILGSVARAILLWLAPPYGFTGDHVDYVCWGRLATTAGVLDLYRTAPAPCEARYFTDGAWIVRAGGTGERLNYPPLAAYVLGVQGWILARFDPTMLGNTVTARTVFALGTTIAELLTALGVAALLRPVLGARAAMLALGATWLAPTLLLDGPFWGQTESWVLAPAVWMLVAMARERWILAGALFGVALALKPSGLLFGPVWLYVFLFRRARAAIVAGGVAALAVVNLAALPFWLDSGRAWLDRVYLDNYVYALHWTTAMAFNVWYADLLATGILDPRVPILGLARDTWGTIFLAAGLALAYTLARRWELRRPDRAALGVVPLTALVTLVAIMLPTRVHSTYGAFTAPFLIATAFLVPRATLATIACMITISLQILSWQWGTLLAMHVYPDESVFPPERRARRQEMRAVDRPREWALTVANLAAAAAFAAAVASARRRDDAPSRA
jgi:hypothetical protein